MGKITPPKNHADRRDYRVVAIVSLIVLGSTFAPPGQAQNLVVNGSFESPAESGNADIGRQQYLAPSTGITGWTVSGSGDVYVHKSPEIGDAVEPHFNFAQDGTYYLDLSGSGTHATIFQDISTVPATSYRLFFYIGASAWTPPAATINVQLTGTTPLLNTTLTPPAPSTNINWALNSFCFVANSTNTRLSFVDISALDDNSSYVDNVAVVSLGPLGTVASLTEDLIAVVRSCHLPKGTENSLVVKLQSALAALNTCDIGTGCSKFQDFVNETSAQSGKKISADQAETLIGNARAIRSLLGCP